MEEAKRKKKLKPKTVQEGRRVGAEKRGGVSENEYGETGTGAKDRGRPSALACEN